ncbi:MAG: hypothetical protein ABR879_06360, partial [Methanomassiliicoccales archaeon]
MKLTRSIVSKIVAISVVIVVIGAILAVILAPPPATNPEIYTSVGLSNGDSFTYSISGTYNGTAVVGALNATFEVSGYNHNRTIHSNTPKLDADILEWAFAGGQEMGALMFPTPFGVKGVVWTFGFYSSENLSGFSFV